MSNWQQVAGGVLGAVGGFFAGGPVGAIQGFALGFAIASYVFPPKIEGAPKSKDPFQVTGASQGAPWPVVFGRRIVKGNVIFFDNAKLRADEITPSGKGKGIGKGASDDDYGIFYFAPVGIGLCAGRVSQLHAILDSKAEDWDAEASKRGGDPYTLSTPTTLQDFGYGPAVAPSAEPASSPLRVCSHVYSPKAYLGKNVTNMTPLNFDVTVAVSQASIIFVGDPLAGMPAGCVNPANIYYDICCDPYFSVGLAESHLSKAGFMAAAQIYRDEGVGLAPKWDSLTNLRSWVADLNFHTHSIFRRGADGKLEPFPIRATNYTAIPLPEKDLQDENAAAQTWDDLPNVFTASFRDGTALFIEKTLSARNEAAIRLSGKQTPKSYDFPHITDETVARWRLEVLKRRESYPYIALSVSLPIKYHKLLVGDVVLVTNSKYQLVDFPMRVSEIKMPEFGKVKMVVKLIQEVAVVEEQLAPPTPSPTPVPMPDPEPLTPVVGHWEPDWPTKHAPPAEPPGFPPPGGSPRPGPDGGPFYGADDETGYFGYPLFLLPGAGKASDVGAGFVVDQGLSLPAHDVPTTLVTSKAYSFRLDEAMTFGWRYASEKRVKVTQLSEPDFPYINQDSPDSDGILDLDRSPYLMLIGNYEICLWGRANKTGDNTYEFERVMRAQNKVRLRTWPVGTLITVFRLRVPAIQGSDEWVSWAHRPRGVSKTLYDAGHRLRIYANGVSYSRRMQSADDQAVITAEPLMSVNQSGAASSSLYKPDRLLKANRPPMVAAQAIKIVNSITTERDRVLWYPLPNVALPAGGWIVQIMPVRDFEGLGDVVICDTVPETPVGVPGGVLPARTTDLAHDQFTQDITFGRVWEHFRLRIYADHAAWIAQGAPHYSLFQVSSLNSTWPTFIIDPSVVAGLSMQRVVMAVDVLAKNGSGEYSPPSIVSVHGVGCVLQYASTRGEGLNDPDAP